MNITCEYCTGYQYALDGDKVRTCSITGRKVEAKERKCGHFEAHQFFYCKLLGIRLAIEICLHKRKEEGCSKCSQHVTIDKILELKNQFKRDVGRQVVKVEKPSMFSRERG